MPALRACSVLWFRRVATLPLLGAIPSPELPPRTPSTCFDPRPCEHREAASAVAYTRGENDPCMRAWEEARAPKGKRRQRRGKLGRVQG